MAEIKIKIDLQSTTEDVISGFTANVGVNNVSKLTSETTTKNNGVAGLSFAKGYLKFTNGFLSNYDGTSGVAQMERGYNGFMFGAVAEDKTYTCTLTITGTNIDSIYIYGDKEAGQFPTEAYLDGDSSNLIYSDDNDWAIRFTSPQNSHSITFTKWNRPNYNACFTHLAVLLNELWLDKSWIKNVESLSQSTASPNEIYYGVLANSGSANIIDRNGEILDYIEDGVLDNSNLPMTIYSNGKEVQYHIINDSDYDTNSITLSIEMNNDLNDWDILQYGGRSLTSETTAYVVLSDILLSINYTQVEIDEMLDTEIVYGTENTEGSVKAYLQAITIPYPYLEADTMRNTIDKFCNLAQLQVLKNSDNKIKFVSARPIATTNQITNTLVVPARNQKSQLKEAKVLKNKYEAVEMNELKTSINTIYNNSIYSNSIFDFDESKILYSTSSSAKLENGTNLSGNPAIKTLDAQFTSWTTRQGLLLYSKATCYQDTIRIYKKQNNNLDNILSLSNNISDLDCSVTYKTYRANATSNVANPTREDIILTDYVQYGDLETKSLNPSYFFDSYYSVGGVRLAGTITLKDTTSISILEEEDYYDITYKVLIGKEDIGMFCNYTVGNTPNWKSSFSVIKYEPIQFDISFLGNKRTISFSNISASDSNVSTAKTVAKVEDSSLLQENTKFSDTKVSTIIKDNIKEDYVNGIANATITITCSDYYDKNGVKAKDWTNGDLINVGDIVRIDKDNAGNSASVYKNGQARIWRVTGRKFRYAGVPLCDLELQEIKQG